MSEDSATPAHVLPREVLPFERYDWLCHLHFVRNDCTTCTEEIDRLQVQSEYGLYLKGLIRLRQGDARGALQHFKQLNTSDNATYIKAIARCLLILGKHNNVCDIIKEEGLRLTQQDWQLWTLLGYALLFSGHTEQAKEAFESALKSTSQVEPFIALAKCLIAESDFKSAIFVLRRASEISPNDVYLATKLGILLYTTGVTTKGVEKILVADSQCSSSDLSLTLAMGTIMQEMRKNADQALTRYRQTDVLECPALWNNVALCFASRSKYVAAVTCLKKAFFLHPLDWRINYNLGLVNFKLKQYASAFQHFKNTISFNSNSNPMVLSMLAICLEFLQDSFNANQVHQTACKIVPMSPASTMSLINYAVFLYNRDHVANKEEITELLMQFEKCWLQRKNNGQFEENVIKAATMLALNLDLTCYLTWTKQE